MDLTPLADFMDVVSVDTWNRINVEDQRGGRFGEVTITEVAVSRLRDFADTNGVHLDFYQAGQNEEKDQGVDVEIWAELADGKWLGYSLQAKRVNPHRPPPSYLELSHPGSDKFDEEFQYETLIRHAKEVESNPVHLLFNGWPAGESGLPSEMGDGIDPPELFGCATISTHLLAKVRGNTGRKTRRVKAFAPFMAPWSTLFRTSSSLGDGESGGTSDRFPSASTVNARGEGIDTRDVDSLQLHPHAAQSVGEIVIAKTLPEYLVYAVAGELKRKSDTDILPRRVLKVTSNQDGQT